jgi:hypothetical protein
MGVSVFSPRFVALLAAVTVLAAGTAWFLVGTTSTAALQQLVDSKPSPDRNGGQPAYDFSIDATHAPPASPCDDGSPDQSWRCSAARHGDRSRPG